MAGTRFHLPLAHVAICAALISVAMPARAQAPAPPPAPQSAANPMCVRLEAQLASIDRGGADAGKADQVRRYEEAAAKQQGELDRVTAQAKRMGCDSSGFFSLFSGPSAQCGPVNTQIQQMRANLDQITTNLERLRGGGSPNMERDTQRRAVLLALAQNNCGPQYAAAARGGGPGNFIDNLFGNSAPGGAPADLGPPSSTFRTVCVRTCDGFYFPVSFATTQARFADDEKTCKSLCPASEAQLYSYRNPGEDINQAVSISGQPYPSSPNAFKYRQAFDASCSCKAAGQTWSDALKTIDDKAAIEQGDIIVTEERAKKMALPPPVKTTATSPATAVKKNAAPATTAPPAAAPAAPTTDGTTADGKPIRSVGPNSFQVR